MRGGKEAELGVVDPGAGDGDVDGDALDAQGEGAALPECGEVDFYIVCVCVWVGGCESGWVSGKWVTGLDMCHGIKIFCGFVANRMCMTSLHS